jgi:ribonuclease Z
MNKKTPLTIYYPEGCLEIEHIHNAFEKVYKTTLPYQIKLKPVNGKKIIRSKDVSIKPFEVIHKEILNDGKGKRQVPALGYNFIYNKMKICYGGDTAFCDTLVKSAKGADLAIIEAGHGDEESDDMHMSFKEAKTIGETAKEYFLVHVPE